MLAACGTTSKPPMTVTTTFPVTVFTGTAVSSPLDPLMGQTIAISIVFTSIDSNHGDGNDPPDCKTQLLYGDTTRTATGASAAVVQAQILDMLPDWELKLQLCSGADSSSVVLEATIDALNLSFGCLGVPPDGMAIGADGYPVITSFDATQCSATILDVVNNRVVGNDDFAMTIATGPGELP